MKTDGGKGAHAYKGTRNKEKLSNRNGLRECGKETDRKRTKDREKERERVRNARLIKETTRKSLRTLGEAAAVATTTTTITTLMLMMMMMIMGENQGDKWGRWQQKGSGVCYSIKLRLNGFRHWHEIQFN